ncbi:hypothetical protein [Streptomyces sp. NPDC058045]|uniref:hypothetical protein n=1 Tax=Streptomyces sp. NPDC058045 TaxID=3346311 RepID=UPI0036EA597D
MAGWPGGPGSGGRLLRWALLTDLVCGEVFKFTVNQFAAVTGLALSLALLWIVTPHAGEGELLDRTARLESRNGLIMNEAPDPMCTTRLCR